ncbi:abc transporter [Cordyceps militaris CM01]|uniref:Abc transporter n=1 Tax=Cordyceps militaris (strain CM01) TaxID=983644 RepID=G3JPJ6_CORMM|nr:abc transporter [Cordyceps militaris CM01]EGX89806.1 abc transporter [Cordyceps militaris CM01]
MDTIYAYSNRAALHDLFSHARHGDGRDPAWVQTIVALGRHGAVQIAITSASLLWAIARTIKIRHDGLGKAVPYKPKGTFLYEALGHLLRGVSLALFLVAGSHNGRQWSNAIAVGYLFLLGLFRILVRGATRPMLLHQIALVSTVTLVLTAAADLLPLIVLKSTYRPDVIVSLSIASLASTVLVLGFSPREWQPPRAGIDVPEGFTAVPSDEETRSWINENVTFAHIDKLVYKSFTGTITMEDMPNIPWHYHPELLRHGFSAMRTKKKTTARTIFDLLAPQILQSVILGISYPFFELCGPLSLYQILEYIRNPEAATLQPYVWLIVLFGGRLLQSILLQKFISLTRKIAMYCKIMLTGEVFHAALGSRELNGNILQDAEKNEEEATQSREGTAAGMLENLISTDMNTITSLRVFLMAVAQIPASVLAVVGLYNVIGWPMFAGLFIVFLSAPISGYIMGYMMRFEKKLKVFQDVRVSMLSEYLRSIKAIKYFGWEDSIVSRVRDIRAKEQRQNWNISMCWVVFSQVTSFMPICSLLAIFGLYVGILNLPMTASVAYTTVTLFDTVRGNLDFISAVVLELPKILVSLRRFDSFFAALDPLDRYPEGPLRIHRATFRRNRAASFSLSDITIDFVENGLNTITGISGSGKTTLLLALLGETIKEAGTVTRPRDAAFASQTAWLQAQSIRENILFTLKHDERRYRSVVSACCLDVDFAEFANGDMTQVGENGAALSGGQRARIALARALYSFASLLVLDDIFSALDTKTTVLNRTVILVTQLNWVVGEADLAITLEDGSVKSTDQNLGHVRVPQNLPAYSSDDLDNAAPATDVEETPNLAETEKMNLIDDEVEKSGVLGGFPVLQYLMYFGGPIAVILTMGVMLAQTAAELVTKYWLRVWVDNANTDVSASTSFYLSIFVALSLGTDAINAVCFWTFIRGAWYAARTLHENAVHALFNVSLGWYTDHPVGRVINRLSGDMETLDQNIIGTVFVTTRTIIMSIMMLTAITWILPVFMGPTVVLAGLGIFVGVMYNQNAIYLKQLVSASQSPILSSFSEGLNGMAVIRATSSLPGLFSEQLGRLLTSSAQAGVSQIDADQWIKFRMNTISGLINVCAAFLAIWESDRLSAGIVGFCLSQATDISSAILMLVFQASELNLQMQTFHRVRQYGKLPLEEESLSEDKLVPDDAAKECQAAPPNWPATGAIEFRNVTVRYGPDGPDVLKNINLRFNAGERVAVVGRTGSGKSTLVLSMLRFTNIVSGQILYDGVDVTSIPYKELRQAISMIPQESQLFQGTLAENLDPTDTISQADLQKALDVCQSIAAIKTSRQHSATASDDDERSSADTLGGGLTLETQVKAKGENFSHGQRQVLSLCRILARQSKLMLLDEATSNMDAETDAGIQTALREAAAEGQGRCLVTIAHRLQSIADYDRVVVMGSGEVLEVGSPRELMEKKGSYYDLVMHDHDATSAEGSSISSHFVQASLQELGHNIKSPEPRTMVNPSLKALNESVAQVNSSVLCRLAFSACTKHCRFLRRLGNQRVGNPKCGGFGGNWRSLAARLFKVCSERVPVLRTSKRVALRQPIWRGVAKQRDMIRTGQTAVATCTVPKNLAPRPMTTATIALTLSAPPWSPSNLSPCSRMLHHHASSLANFVKDFLVEARQDEKGKEGLVRSMHAAISCPEKRHGTIHMSSLPGFVVQPPRRQHGNMRPPSLISKLMSSPLMMKRNRPGPHAVGTSVCHCATAFRLPLSSLALPIVLPQFFSILASLVESR